MPSVCVAEEAGAQGVEGCIGLASAVAFGCSVCLGFLIREARPTGERSNVLLPGTWSSGGWWAPHSSCPCSLLPPAPFLKALLAVSTMPGQGRSDACRGPPWTLYSQNLGGRRWDTWLNFDQASSACSRPLSLLCLPSRVDPAELFQHQRGSF